MIEVYLGRPTCSIRSLTDIERVEVLRGLQGTLFGRNTIGGAILVTNREPDLSDAYVNLFGNFGERSLFELKGVANAPVSDPLAVKISTGMKKQDGYESEHITPGSAERRRIGDEGVRGLTFGMR